MSSGSQALPAPAPAPQSPQVSSNLDVFSADFPKLSSLDPGVVLPQRPKTQPAKPGKANKPPKQLPPVAPGKRLCPHCDYENAAEAEFCAVCRKDLKAEAVPRDDSKKKPKDWMYVAGGIGLALLTTPIFFLMLCPILGGELALLACAVEILWIAAVGSFAVACGLFNQDTPEVSDIFRLTARSNLAVKVVIVFLVEKLGMDANSLLCVGLATGLSIAVASFLCMVSFQMPVFHSIGISICYNILAAVLTVAGVILLKIVFAGWLVATSAGDPHRMMQQFGSPQNSSPLSAPDDDDEQQSSGAAPQAAPDESRDPHGRTLGPFVQAARSVRSIAGTTRFVASPLGHRTRSVLPLTSRVRIGRGWTVPIGTV
jgi:hypothetical protein